MRVYIARQPIFNRKKRIVSYELLYRNGQVNAFDPSVEENQATCEVISNAFTTFNLETLTDRKKAFINFTADLLMQEIPRMLDPKKVVVEILEDVKPCYELLSIIGELKESGYSFALDDYTGNPSYDVFLEYVDIVKVDFRLVKGIKRNSIAKKLQGAGVSLLAEKVETQEDFQQAFAAGYQLFQGYYFAEPIILSKSSSNISATTYARVLQIMSGHSPDYDSITEIIQADVKLSYKILHRINTLEYYRSHRVSTLKNALIRMGFREIKRWLTLILMSDSISRGDEETARMALVRGVFAEELAEEMRLSHSEDAFNVGMFSLLNVIFEDDLITLLDDICISPTVKAALCGERNALRDLLDFVIAYSQGEWQEASRIYKDKLDMGRAADCYIMALRYSDIAFDESVLFPRRN